MFDTDACIFMFHLAALFVLFYFKFIFIMVQLTYSVVSISAVQHRHPVICIYVMCVCMYMCVCMCIHSFSYIIFHHGLYQETGYSSLCYTAGPHHSLILNVMVCIHEPQIPTPSHSLPLRVGNYKSVFHVCESASRL